MFKILDEKCNPSKTSPHSPSVQLKSRIDLELAMGESAIIPLGVKIDLDLNKHHDLKDFCYFQLSLVIHQLISSKGVEIIDLTSEDELSITVYNPIPPLSMEPLIPFKLKKGEVVCEAVLLEHKSYLCKMEENGI